MAGVGTGADLDCSIFSAEGRVFQVEYAGKAIDSGATAVGICCKDGVVVATEKLLASKMLEKGTSQRAHAVDYQAGILIAGVLPDGRNIVNRAREEAAQIRDVYGVPIQGQSLANRVGEYMHLFTQSAGARPLGCNCFVASYADDGPQLFLVDPSGHTVGYYACAAGKAKTPAKTALETIDFSKVTCAEAVKKACEVLYDVHDATKDKLFELEVAWVCDASKRRFQHVPANLIPPPPAAAAGSAAAAAP